MSFSETSGLTVPQKLSCAAYAVFGGLISFYLMVGAALADCTSENDCISEATRAIMFFGAPLLTLAGGVFLTRYFMRDKD
ncbi:hypothetical protein [Qipengyuania sp.]|uniref:hypothetical protein n=1 Tax=Qipengyuania sp. TaxID=2004515 RepID=UPI0035182806